ncbi:Putative basic-leucine zipper domain-containing protein [Colletotrichum destructivum]|uniref:Basic-leucine zipper domain-containing protein n=1 Tax=Colletotrichum destructivum TaxID=34406 RepID=A0AAX4I4W3_9PEZI|nr:Putative basic-leucine zipper domain-containing protein [Colletotrichum destructivum]
MVSTYQMPNYYRPTPLTVDTTQAQKYYEEEDHSILDESILDHSALDSGLEMSPPMADSRRESFAIGGSLFSPKTEDWQSVEMQSVPSNNPFIEQHTNNNPFMRLDHAQPHPSPFGPQGNAWSLSNTSGSCTPLQQFDGLPAEYDSGAPMFQRPVQGQTPFTNPTGQINMFAPIGSGNQSIPTSPQKGWLGQAEPMAKKMRPGSPAIRSHNDMRRGDGIRKKNARFDIPAERNLSNIDNLISQSTDEQEIKELKQQKRLLRNRQAALDSRQRKKQHTERLEDEKKQFTAVLTDMEDEMAEMRKQMEQLLREKQFNQEYIESLTMEKEEMMRSHTIETGELRKKVSVLTDHVQRLENAAMAAPANNNFVSGYDDMDGMTMPGTWDSVNFLGEYPMEQEVKQELQVIPTKKTDNTAFPVESEKPSSQGGILFMLFLVGAFVLSSRSTPAIPRVSEDVRAEAATLLESVFKDAGINGASNTMNAVAPQPSGGSWVDNSAVSMGDTSMGGVAPSMLGQLGDSLTQPTDEQANEQLFGLSAAQYNGVNSQDFLGSAPERSTSQGRKNLADALAAMRNTKQSAADVYTRSLLWDQIPSEVVRNFAKMVSESNSAKVGANE